MPLFGFLVVMEPENFRIFLQHVVVNVYKISNHSDMVMFLANGMECLNIIQFTIHLWVIII